MKKHYQKISTESLFEAHSVVNCTLERTIFNQPSVVPFSLKPVFCELQFVYFETQQGPERRPFLSYTLQYCATAFPEES